MDVYDKIKLGWYNCKPNWKHRSFESRMFELRCLHEMFKLDALRYVGLEFHPRKNMAFEKAWKEEHTNGLIAVVMELQTLATLMIVPLHATENNKEESMKK